MSLTRGRKKVPEDGEGAKRGAKKGKRQVGKNNELVVKSVETEQGGSLYATPR